MQQLSNSSTVRKRVLSDKKQEEAKQMKATAVVVLVTDAISVRVCAVRTVAVSVWAATLYVAVNALVLRGIYEKYS